MKLKLAGVALGALMVGLVSAGAAKADAVATADIDISNAVFTNGATLLSDLAISNSANTLQAQTSLNGSSSAPPATQGNIFSPTIEESTPATLTSGGSSSSAYASISGNLFGAAPSGAAVTHADSSQNLKPVSQGASGVTQNGTSVEFVSSTSLTTTLSLSGSITFFASVSHNGESATASGKLQFTLRDNTNGGTSVTYSLVDNGGVFSLQSGTSDVMTGLSVLNPAFPQGSSTPLSFSNLSAAFNIIAGHDYTFQIIEQTSTSATAVPEPGTLALFGAGLAGLGFFGTRRRKSGGLSA
jgi:hypothetical protein